MDTLAEMIRTRLKSGALPGSLDYILFLNRERTPVLDLRLDFVYSCFGLFLIAVVVRSAWAAIGLVGPRWRSYI